MHVERLQFDNVRQAYPERWEKARPGNQWVNPHDRDPGRYICRRQGSDEWHQCTLVTLAAEYFGRCDCSGFEHHSGPCSHLCAVYRIISDDTDVYQPRIVEADVELRSPAEERAQNAAEPDLRAATDGGGR